MIAVKVTSLVTTSTHGVMSPGDILRIDPAFARHLVEDCRAAVYLDTPQPQQQDEQEPTKARKRKGA